ncbi:type II toxin-antitoxin system ParD family antitoxin [Sphingorhabdus sp. SMR4y]|uniref:ribbon-helix-helix domain-containing protein n=1 Tax=Sphingorhabdus sp. SMR4y TaxID=2584094 RepID=UPI001641C806|nr:hypothetical protein [Sphingorhabdus sp. SMR4y]
MDRPSAPASAGLLDYSEFTNDSAYIRDLVKRDQSQQGRLATLRAAIAEGLANGTSD